MPLGAEDDNKENDSEFSYENSAATLATVKFSYENLTLANATAKFSYENLAVVRTNAKFSYENSELSSSLPPSRSRVP